MCGIAGFFLPDASPSGGMPDRQLLKRMTDAIAHRGPDAEGFHTEPGVALGHRRLSVIDVRTGQQPLGNEDDSVLVVFNGEIYNFQTLTAELEAAGHVFRTRSDTEVIVHGWEEWGEACVERFRGMFAFALWDRRRRSLFLARDRLGVKPLYYGVAANGALVFGSEAKALLQHPGMNLGIDEQAVEEYFALGYVPDPRSIWTGIRKLPPAHTMLVRAGTPVARVAPRQYWQAVFEPDPTLTRERAIDELGALLEESVGMRMISEVPLGAFLSGGVDSSVVVALMAGLSREPVKTCSIGFSDSSVDESRHALEVARQFGTDHENRIVDTDDFPLIDTLAAAYDEPYADSSALPTWRVCELARGKVTVALSGDGGDETFGGYRRYRMHLAEERMRGLLPDAIRRPVFGALATVYPKADWAPRVLRAKTTLAGIARDSVGAYTDSVAMIKSHTRDLLLASEFRQRLGGYRVEDLMRGHAAQFRGSGALALIQHLDYRTYLPGDINTKVDRASMAHSLEVREPLMDHRLVEWAARLPQHLKIAGTQGKLVLKEAFRGRLSDDILFRPKQGFITPLPAWFRGPLHGLATELLPDGLAVRGGYLRAPAIRTMLDEHRSGVRNWATPLWSILMFEKFLRRNAGAAA